MIDDMPMLEFVSHVKGKNAKVKIWPDRIEWSLDKRKSAAMATMTLGASLLSPRKNAGTEMIPIKSINSVTTKRDGMLNTLVMVVTSGNTIGFRVSHNEAAQVREVLNRLILAAG